jgi:hypothetical protein
MSDDAPVAAEAAPAAPKPPPVQPDRPAFEKQLNALNAEIEGLIKQRDAVQQKLNAARSGGDELNVSIFVGNVEFLL